MSYADLAPLIARASSWAGIPSGVLSGLLNAESGYELNPPNSSAGAIGPAQMMPDTARALNIDPTKPEESVYGAAYLLRQAHDEFGSWPLAVAAYNAGPQAVRDYGGVPPYDETQTYVAKVLAGYNYDQPQAGSRPLGSAQSAAIADSVRNGLLGGTTMPSTTTNAGSAAAAPQDIAGGTGIEAIMQQLAQMMSQMRGTNSATAGIMDPRLLTGSQSTDVSGYLPTLAKQQFDRSKMEADRQYALDVDKYGLSVAQFNYQQRLQTAQLSLDTLTKMATLNGPKDQIAYQYALKGLQAPAPTSQTNLGDPNGLLGGLATPGAPNSINQPYGGGSTLGVKPAGPTGSDWYVGGVKQATTPFGVSPTGRWDSATQSEYDRMAAIAAKSHGEIPIDSATGQVSASYDAHPEVNGIQGAGWTPDTYSDSPYTPGDNTSQASAVQTADLPGGGTVSWDPNAPGNGLPGYAQGGLLEGVADEGAPSMPPAWPNPGDAGGAGPNPLEDGNGELNWDGDHMPTNSGGLLDDVEGTGALIASIVRHMGDGSGGAAPAAGGAGAAPSAAVVGDVPGKITGGEEIAKALPPKNGRSRFEIDPLSRSKDPAEVAAKMPPMVQRAALGGIFGGQNINDNGTGGPGTPPSGAVYGPDAIGNQPAIQAIKNPGTPQPRFTGFTGGLSNPDYGLLDLPSAPSAQVLEGLLPSQMDSLQSAYEQGVGADFRDITAMAQAASPVGHGRYGDRGRYGSAVYGD